MTDMLASTLWNIQEPLLGGARQIMLKSLSVLTHPPVLLTITVPGFRDALRRR